MARKSRFDPGGYAWGGMPGPAIAVITALLSN